MQHKKKIRILQCIRQGQVGGGESHLLSLVENIDTSIFEPVVLSFTGGAMIDQLNANGTRNYVIPTTTPFDVRVFNKITRLLKDEKIDVIHCHGTRAISNLFGPARTLKIPIIYTIHGWSFHDDQSPFVKKIRILSERFLTSQAQRNIAVSDSNMQTGKNLIPKFDAIVVNNGIDQSRFNATNQYKDIRQELGISKEATLVIFIARFNKQKQPLVLLNAFNKAVKLNPTIRLLMVGDGEDKAKALKLSEAQVAAGLIYYQPFRQDVPALLAAADIFVLPSLWEGMPIGLLEAMSMGKAIIATNVDGTKEIIKDLYNGLLIDPADLKEQLPVAINTLAENKELRNQLSLNAVNTINEHFSAATMTRKIEQIYESVSGV